MSQDREALIARARAVAAELGKPAITPGEFMRASGVTSNQVGKHFDGFRALLRAAGVYAPLRNDKIDDGALMQAMHDAFLVCGGIVERRPFLRACRYSTVPYITRWGTWPEQLAAFKAWASANRPDFPWLDALPSTEEARGMTARARAVRDPSPRRQAPRPAWTPRGGPEYGDYLTFRWLQHAPTCEQGVVFLFGMVAGELGFVVESIGTSFPDCEAKRLIGRGRQRWERVRIEFELRSRAFREHRHDPGGCDLIVCWEHDWPDCTLEVLALSDALKRLKGGPDNVARVPDHDAPPS